LAPAACAASSSINTPRRRPRPKPPLAKADKEYEEGKKAEAVAVYKDNFSFSKDKATHIKRIVEVEAEKGDKEEARKWVEKGFAEKLDVKYEGQAAQQVYAAVKKERDEQAAKKKAEEEARARHKAEEEAQAKQRAEGERRAAAQKSEEEYEKDGLVLLNKTVRATRGEVGFTVTGTVVNRRNQKLTYAEILRGASTTRAGRRSALPSPTSTAWSRAGGGTSRRSV